MSSLTIGQSAQVEIWREVRKDSWRRFAFHFTIGFIYLFLSLIVGAYLFASLSQMEFEVPDLSSFSYETTKAHVFSQFARLYIVLIVLVALTFALLLLAMLNGLPASFSAIFFRLPFVGSIRRILAMSEFYQSLYGSVGESKTYSEAFGIAAQDVSDRAIRVWSLRSSQRLANGEPVDHVLKSSPILDHPLPIVIAMLPSVDTGKDSIRLWHQAALECHTLLQSRVNRILRLLSVIFFVSSVFAACLPVFLPILGITHVFRF